MKKIKYALTIIILLSTLFTFTGCLGLGNDGDYSFEGIYCDTVVTVEILGVSGPEPLEGCEEILTSYQEMFNFNDENSEIYKINHSGGQPVEVSDQVIEVIELGLYYSELTEGAFDITIAPVYNLWGFSSDSPAVPSDADLQAALGHVDYSCVKIDGNTVNLTDPDAMIDVNAIVKGYIADDIASYLKSQGVEHAIINMGGNLVVIGGKPDGSPYNLGVQDPFNSTGEVIDVVSLVEGTLVTSGIYERNFEENGILYHHILNTNDGYPTDNGLVSVTIIAESSKDADALSTACFLLGLDKGLDLINSLENVNAIFITEDGTLHYSDGYPN